MAVLLTLGTDADTINSGLRRGDRLNTSRSDPMLVQAAMRFVDGRPCAVAGRCGATAMLTLTLNLWLATKVTQTSGRLQRPVARFEKHRTTADDARCIMRCDRLLLRRRAGRDAGPVVTTALLIVTPLSALPFCNPHSLSLNGRVFWLGSAYAAIFLSGWLVLVIAALGLADAVFGFRKRYMRGRPPPISASLKFHHPFNQPHSSLQRRTEMEVILLERVAKLGQMGEVVRVKDGFARNFLLTNAARRCAPPPTTRPSSTA